MADYRPIFPDNQRPLMIMPDVNLSLAELIDAKKVELRSLLIAHGALLFRGFHVKAPVHFDDVVKCFSNSSLKYIYRSTPRTEVTERVYTATVYPRDLEIPLHNENSYQRSWPLTIAFCCLQPAHSGGETPIADMHIVNAEMPQSLMDKCEELGIEYIRHYHEGIDLPWQEVFQTDRRSEMEMYCRQNCISYNWLPNGLLRTSQLAQGVAYHPYLDNRTFFNQAHLFHVSSLGAERASAVRSCFGDKLPRHARFGDGSEIVAEELDAINAAFEKATLSFPWEQGDVLVLDNMQFAHGRRPFRGPRNVLAALMDPHDASH